jgi:hypothetical protein
MCYAAQALVWPPSLQEMLATLTTRDFKQNMTGRQILVDSTLRNKLMMHNAMAVKNHFQHHYHEMGMPYSVHGGNEKCIQHFEWES